MFGSSFANTSRVKSPNVNLPVTFQEKSESSGEKIKDGTQLRDKRSRFK